MLVAGERLGGQQPGLRAARSRRPARGPRRAARPPAPAGGTVAIMPGPRLISSAAWARSMAAPAGSPARSGRVGRRPAQPERLVAEVPRPRPRPPPSAARRRPAAVVRRELARPARTAAAPRRAGRGRRLSSASAIASRYASGRRPARAAAQRSAARSSSATCRTPTARRRSAPARRSAQAPAGVQAPAQVPGASLVRLAGVVQQGGAVLADGLQRAVAGSRPGPRRRPAGSGRPAGPAAAGHLRRPPSGPSRPARPPPPRGERGRRTTETRRSTRPLGLAQQGIAPVQRRAQRAVPVVGPRAAGQQVAAGRPARPPARPGPATGAGQRPARWPAPSRRARGRSRRPGRGRAGGQRAPGRGRTAAGTAPPRPRAAVVRPSTDSPGTGNTHSNGTSSRARLVASTVSRGQPRSSRSSSTAHRVEQMLAVVEDAAASRAVAQPAERRSSSTERPWLLAEAERGRHRRRDHGRVGHRHQIHVPGPVGEPPGHVGDHRAARAGSCRRRPGRPR